MFKVQLCLPRAWTWANTSPTLSQKTNPGKILIQPYEYKEPVVIEMVFSTFHMGTDEWRSWPVEPLSNPFVCTQPECLNETFFKKCQD